MKVKIMKPWFSKVMKNYTAITLWPFGVYAHKKLSKTSLQHESIHWVQQREMLGIFFYLWYSIEWGIKCIIPPKGSYLHLGFEREAYINAKLPGYLQFRQPYSWLNYIKK